MSDFFPPRPTAHPMIYAYKDTNPQYAGLLKVGYTAIDVNKRVAQQYPLSVPTAASPTGLFTGSLPCTRTAIPSLTVTCIRC